MTRKDVKGDQPSGGETTWTNTGATRYGRGQHKTVSFGDDMLRPSPNHGTQRLPNDDEMMTYKVIRINRVIHLIYTELNSSSGMRAVVKYRWYKLLYASWSCDMVYWLWREPRR